ncbi:MAG TPA: helix-turn-helix domain-containing protein [Thermoplasmata archaeon]|nr:helix-turn-helix domain-containing protein [Thermoplasmata archaeon]
MARPVPPLADLRSTFALIGQKHVMPILYALFRQSPRRFGELREETGCNPATLSDRLRKLERFGLIERRALHVVPRQVEYSLTAWMREFQPVWLEMMKWQRRAPGAVRPARARGNRAPTSGRAGP